jgi:serine/threonine protein kinase
VLAVHEASGLPVALRYHAAPERFEALRADARALVEVRSPHIAALYEHIEVVLDGVFGVATVREYVRGASVRTLLAASRPSPASALLLVRCTLLALRAAQAAGVTHRALTLSNVLVSDAGVTRITDFFPAHRSAPHENGGFSPQSWILEDVRSAHAVFAACVPKSPKALRGLAAVAETGDGAALLDAVETAGPAAFGPQWRSHAEQELARLVAKHGRER